MVKKKEQYRIGQLILATECVETQTLIKYTDAQRHAHTQTDDIGEHKMAKHTHKHLKKRNTCAQAERTVRNKADCPLS